MGNVQKSLLRVPYYVNVSVLVFSRRITTPPCYWLIDSFSLIKCLFTKPKDKGRYFFGPVQKKSVIFMLTDSYFFHTSFIVCKKLTE